MACPAGQVATLGTGGGRPGTRPSVVGIDPRGVRPLWNLGGAPAGSKSLRKVRGELPGPGELGWTFLGRATPTAHWSLVSRGARSVQPSSAIYYALWFLETSPYGLSSRSRRLWGRTPFFSGIFLNGKNPTRRKR